MRWNLAILLLSSGLAAPDIIYLLRLQRTPRMFLHGALLLSK